MFPLARPMTRSPHGRFVGDQAGQSLVEIALVMPLLLLMILGLADLGRAFYYTTAITNAAREGALFAARQWPAPSAAALTQHTCNETGFVAYNTSCTGMTVTSVADSAQVEVTVVYQLSLITGFMVERLPTSGSALALRARSTFPVVAPQ
ncbi:hypothetical protein BH18CHL2_BH18CHL2_03640 [soil metagenome]